MTETAVQAVLSTYGMLLTMMVLTCLCCACMKFSDLRLKYYIVDTAKRNGVKIDMEKLDPKYSDKTPQVDECCTIMVPDFSVVI